MILAVFVMISWQSGHLSSFQRQQIKGRDTAQPVYTLYVFTGSDWCSNCLRLKQNVLADTVFASNLLGSDISLEIIDFPQRKKLPKATIEYNRSMSNKFSFDGVFPTLVIFSRNTQKFTSFYYGNESTAELTQKIIKLSAGLHE